MPDHSNTTDIEKAIHKGEKEARKENENSSLQRTSSDAPTTRSSNGSDTSANLMVAIDPSILQSVIDGEPLEESTDFKRVSHLCCGVCCDLRRASLIVNGIYFLLTILGLCLILTGQPYVSISLFRQIDNMKQAYDDDEFIAENTQTPMLIFGLVRASCGMVFSWVGIAGALWYNKWLVLATALWMCADIVASIVFYDWMGLVVVIILAYPNIGLFEALHRGTITRQTYGVEEYCCCTAQDH